ncbi:MAG: acyl carrier protein [Eubacterium sp.]
METIKKILAEIRPEYDFENSTDFIEDGYLDSFDLVTLVAELDETFGISIDGLDIIPENFMSVETIADVVKKNGGSL